MVKEGGYMVILCKCFGVAAYATVANLSPYRSNRIDVYPNLRVEKLRMDGLVRMQCLKLSTYMNARCVREHTCHQVAILDVPFMIL